MNPKTGSTSLNKAFEKHAEIRVGRNPQLKHLTYNGLTEMFGSYFQNRGCELFVVVRHPFDVLQSWYRYRSRPELSDPGHRHHVNFVGDMSFMEFMHGWANNDKSSGPTAVSAGIDFCFNGNGELARDVSYFRFEDIDRLARKLSAKVGVDVELQVKNKSPEREISFNQSELEKIPKLSQAIKIYNSIDFQTR